jgi:3-hydroxy-9,10-secoandrosta-1,3,5(10)-triene-9,17-dione monooxygenase
MSALGYPPAGSHRGAEDKQSRREVMSALDTPRVEAVTDEELIARAHALKPLLARNAAEVDAGRRVVDENIAALEEAGLFRITVPRRLGGYEVPFATKLKVSAALGEACGSTSWVVTLINVCNWLVSLYPERAQQEVWGADANAKACGVLAPSATARKVDGGFEITGTWGYASGCLHSQWAILGLPLVDDAGETVGQGLALIPMSDLRIEDTWFVAGMRGTGSNTLHAEGVFVPHYRILDVPAAIDNQYGTEHKDEALYRSSFIPALVLVLAGPQLGMARGVLDTVIEKAPKRVIAYTVFEQQTASTTFQNAVSDAAMHVDTAVLHSERAAADIDAAAQRGEKMTYLARARVRADVGWAIRHARQAIDELISANGASSFADVSPIQRLWRDSATGGRHAVIMPSVNQEVYGKALLGIPYEANITPLI